MCLCICLSVHICVFHTFLCMCLSVHMHVGVQLHACVHLFKCVYMFKYKCVLCKLYLASSFCSITCAHAHTCAHTQRIKDRNRFCSVGTFHSVLEFWREWDLFPLCSRNDPSGLNKTSLNSQPPYSSFPSLPCLNKLFTRNSTGCLPSQSAAESACQSSLRATTTARLVSGHARKSTMSRLTDCMAD